jgi:hypothetical protein
MGASKGKPPNALRAKGVEKEEEEEEEDSSPRCKQVTFHKPTGTFTTTRRHNPEDRDFKVL